MLKLSGCGGENLQDSVNQLYKKITSRFRVVPSLLAIEVRLIQWPLAGLFGTEYRENR